jgi:hypothetical protein
MIDSTRENLLSLTEAANRLPIRRGGKRPHVSCLYRWTTSGCRGVVLESISIGGTRCTSAEAMQRFFDRLSQPPAESAPPGQAQAIRMKLNEEAARQLERLGV